MSANFRSLSKVKQTSTVRASVTVSQVGSHPCSCYRHSSNDASSHSLLHCFAIVCYAEWFIPTHRGCKWYPSILFLFYC
ncbi:hypothetical protein SORBI_3005G110427 [Sorghum bicolor]|uniref:Uncharacterized protein n=1 Tax=Sorghum bicolor TaxID=4558 RepID=A0A1Z5RI54_SORBI|nr:hypothetical protein SORBI_3005G110427 [Sorghum bicolor]